MARLGRRVRITGNPSLATIREELPTLPANLCPLSMVPISRGSITHALYATFRFRAQAQSNSM
jgi:hypothetical protein